MQADTQELSQFGPQSNTQKGLGAMAAAVAVVFSVVALGFSLDSALSYFGYYHYGQCGTARTSALTLLLVVPVFMLIPAYAWKVAAKLDVAVSVARCAVIASFAGWLFIVFVVFGLEHLR